MKEITFYKTTSGKCPVKEFLNGLPSKQAQKIAWVLELIEEFELVPSQYLKKMVCTDDLWEIRVIVSSNIFRILGFMDGASLLVLAHAFQKKTQKTPKQAIKIAEDRKREYLKRRIL